MAEERSTEALDINMFYKLHNNDLRRDIMAQVLNPTEPEILERIALGSVGFKTWAMISLLRSLL